MLKADSARPLHADLETLVAASGRARWNKRHLRNCANCAAHLRVKEAFRLV